MSNQDRLLSDEELRSRITKIRKERDLHLMDESEYVDFIIDLINTQKRLYAESVIGDSDVAMTMSPGIKLNPSGGIDNSWTDEHESMRKAQHRDQLRAEQRARIKS